MWIKKKTQITEAQILAKEENCLVTSACKTHATPRPPMLPLDTPPNWNTPKTQLKEWSMALHAQATLGEWEPRSARGGPTPPVVEVAASEADGEHCWAGHVASSPAKRCRSSSKEVGDTG